MLIYGKELRKEDCPFNVDKDTKQFLISFFGFYNHNISNDFNQFLKELEIKKSTGYMGNEPESFKLNGDYGFEAYDCSDRRTFDLTIVLPQVFTSKEDALDWFHNKVNNSEFINLKQICEIDVVDAEKLFLFLNIKQNYLNKIDTIENAFNIEFKNSMNLLQQKMLEDFKDDEEYKRIIKSKFDSISRNYKQ